MAPNLYRLASRKSISVCEGVRGGKWIKSLQRINLEEEIDMFLQIWSKVQCVRGGQLSENPDCVSYKLTACNSYSAVFAYDGQLFGKFIVMT